MSHKKKAHHKGMKNDKQAKVGMIEPMAHGKGAQHLKSMKDHKMHKGK